MSFLTDQKGVTKITTILLVTLILIIVILGYLGYSRSVSEPGVDSTPPLPEDVLITHKVSEYLRGEKSIPETGEVINVFYMLVDGKWEEVKIVDDVILCEKMINLGFPQSFVSDCILEYPRAKTVSEAMEYISNGQASEMGIIGQIGVGNDPSCNSCFNINSGGEDVNVDLREVNIPNDITPGDTVYVEVVVVDEEIVVVGVDKVNDREDDEEEEEELDIEDLLENGLYFDITNLPPGISKEDYYRLLYDIDNSNIDIQIIQDF